MGICDIESLILGNKLCNSEKKVKEKYNEPELPHLIAAYQLQHPIRCSDRNSKTVSIITKFEDESK